MAAEEICRDGAGGFVLPFFEGEKDMEDWIRATIYGLAMIYFFVGVSIIADTFMSSIEVITSRRRQVSLPTGRFITVRIWNDTVANLTLMALGSSAPEILLAVTELFKREMHSGDLGPATIVGSASFNLLAIVAICIVVIPSPEVRRVREVSVFFITVIFMMFAYLWLVLTVSVISPGEVEIWEAVITLLCLPVLVWVSYLADIGTFGKIRLLKRRSVQVKQGYIDRVCDLLGSYDRETQEAVRMALSFAPNLKKCLDNPSSQNVEELRKNVKKHMVTKKSRAARRIEATRALTGGRRVVWNMAPTFHLRGERHVGVTGISLEDIPVALAKGRGVPQVQFAAEVQTMPESALEKPVLVVRSGDASNPVNVAYIVTSFVKEENFNSRRVTFQVDGLGAGLGVRIGNGTPATARSTETSVDLPAKPTVQQGVVSFDRGESRKYIVVKRPTEMTKGHDHFYVELVHVVPQLRRGNTAGSAGSAGGTNLSRGNSGCTSSGTPGSHGPAAPNAGAAASAGSPPVTTVSGGTVGGRAMAARPTNSDEIRPIGRQLELAKAFTRTISLQTQRERSLESAVGPISRTIVRVQEHQKPGKLAFAFERLLIQGTDETQIMEVLVQRRDGCAGKVSCSFRTERLSAVPNYDYKEVDGILEFDDGVTEQLIDLEILPKGENESKDDFLVILEDPVGGAEFVASHDGGSETEILTVHIASRSLDNPTISNAVARWLDRRLNFDEVRLGTNEWTEQLHGAIYCNGSAEEQRNASAVDWAFHFLALPWKLIFVLVPPTAYCHGWVCFWLSLVMIGALTAIIGDLAELFGCVLDLPNIVTAITFVALGTSMPDLFASKTAAVQDPFADASIVNVTGSNSVNVFLGLGLPWTMGAVYWRVLSWKEDWARRYPDHAARLQPSGVMAFVVLDEDLGASVVAFAIVATVALVVLVTRRYVLTGELGGPFRLKMVSASVFVMLWVDYVAFTSWWAVRKDEADFTEGAIVGAVFGGTTCVLLIVFFVLIVRQFVALQRQRPSVSEVMSGVQPSTPTSERRPAGQDFSPPASVLDEEEVQEQAGGEEPSELNVGVDTRDAKAAMREQPAKSSESLASLPEVPNEDAAQALVKPPVMAGRDPSREVVALKKGKPVKPLFALSMPQGDVAEVSVSDGQCCTCVKLSQSMTL